MRLTSRQNGQVVGGGVMLPKIAHFAKYSSGCSAYTRKRQNTVRNTRFVYIEVDCRDYVAHWMGAYGVKEEGH